MRLPASLRFLLAVLVVPVLPKSVGTLGLSHQSPELAIGLPSLLLCLVYVANWVLWPRASRLLGLATIPLAMAFSIAAVNPAALKDPTALLALLVWVYSALVVGSSVPRRWVVPAGAGLIVLALITMVVRAGLADPKALEVGVGYIAVAVVLGMMASTSLVQLVRSNAELREAREALAVAAVQEERSRIARDLHDLLGHTLSLMVVKLGLGLRLLPGTDGAARTELTEVQDLARNALEEVRLVTDGYRRLTLASQLGGARAALDAAGIRVDVEGDVGLLPPDVETALAWTVREAVTNVIRHSGAGACRVTMRRDPLQVALEVSDDGRGASGAVPPRGLLGLAQRLETCGGSLRWSEAGCGFTVLASVPVTVGTPVEAGT